jgi:hypothetical protein
MHNEEKKRELHVAEKSIPNARSTLESSLKGNALNWLRIVLESLE